MANIPVERTSGGLPWWAWLLGLLALLLLGALLLSQCGDDDDGLADTTVVDDTYVEDPVVVTDSAVGVQDGGALTSIEQIREARRAGQLYGREVSLTNVDVEGLAGDSTFFIADTDASGDARLLVVLEDLGESETYAPGPEGTDGRYNVDVNDNIDLDGRIERFTGTERQVTGVNRSRLMPDSLYIRATRVAGANSDTSVRTDPAQ